MKHPKPTAARRKELLRQIKIWESQILWLEKYVPEIAFLHGDTFRYQKQIDRNKELLGVKVTKSRKKKVEELFLKNFKTPLLCEKGIQVCLKNIEELKKHQDSVGDTITDEARKIVLLSRRKEVLK